MALFGRSDDVADLIARRKYPKAIEVLESQIAADPHNTRLKIQLSDVLVAAGRPLEAVPVLIELADHYASRDEAPKAIAALKKIERIAPGRRDVETKLASLIRDKNKPRGAGWTPRQGFEAEGYEASGAIFDESHFASSAVVTDEQRIAAAKSASWVPSTREAEPEPMPIIEILPDPGPAAEGAAPGVSGSPLFGDFSQDELVAVMRGLRLLSFEAGDIIISEGESGDSLFVLASGVAKAFVRRDGRQKLVRRMSEGTFFGEISILSGKPRTATVTAATACELLELDRPTLDEITKSHAHVRSVLEEFYIQRAGG